MEKSSNRWYGVMVVVSGFLIFMISIGVAWSFGVFYIIFLDVFGKSSQLTSWVGAVQSASQAICGPIASTLGERFGNRASIQLGTILAASGLALTSFAPNIIMVIVTFGGMTGFGFGFIMISTIMSLNQYFDETTRDLAYGFASIGTGFGIVFTPYFVRYLVGIYNWQCTMLILGCIMLSLLGLSFLVTCQTGHNQMKSDKNGLESSKQTSKKKSLLEQASVMKNSRFWMYVVNCIFYIIGFLTVNTFVAHHALQEGIVSSRDQTSIFLSVIGLASIFGRFFYTIVCMHPKVDTITIYPVSVFINGLVVMSIVFITDFWTLIVAVAVYGFLTASYSTLYPSIAMIIAGDQFVSGALGYMTLFRSIGSLTAAPLGGFLHDISGHYKYSFFTASVASIISAAALFYPWLHFKRAQSTFKLSNAVGDCKGPPTNTDYNNNFKYFKQSSFCSV